MPTNDDERDFAEEDFNRHLLDHETYADEDEEQDHGDGCGCRECFRQVNGYYPDADEDEEQDATMAKEDARNAWQLNTGLSTQPARDEHRAEAMTRLADASESPIYSADRAILSALTHAVLALSAPEPPAQPPRTAGYPDGEIRQQVGALDALQDRLSDPAWSAMLPGGLRDQLETIVRSAGRMLPYHAEDEDTEDDPAVQAERDRLMPQACGLCGGEVPGDGAPPDHLDLCPLGDPGQAMADLRALTRIEMIANSSEDAGTKLDGIRRQLRDAGRPRR